MFCFVFFNPWKIAESRIWANQLVFIWEFGEHSKVKIRHQLSVMWDHIHPLTDNKPQRKEDMPILKPNNHHTTAVLMWRALIRAVCVCVWLKFSNMMQEWLWRTVLPASRAVLQGKRHSGTRRLESFWKNLPLYKQSHAVCNAEPSPLCSWLSLPLRPLLKQCHCAY